MSFRADAARGHYLGARTGKSAIQRQRNIASHVKTNKEGPAQTRANGEVFEGLGEPKHQVQGVGHQLANVHRIRFGWLLIRQKERVRWSCVDEHRGCHTLELNAEVSVVVTRGRAVRREEGLGRGHGIQELCPGGGNHIRLFVRDRRLCSAGMGVVNRRGVGKTRNKDTQRFWLQNAVRNRELVVQKVAGRQNWCSSEQHDEKWVTV